MKTLGVILSFFAVVAIGILTSIFGTHVFLSIANLYDLKVITDNFTFLQAYGLIILVHLAIYQYKDRKKKEKEESYTKSVFRVLERIGSTAFYYLIAWGLAYVSFLILS